MLTPLHLEIIMHHYISRSPFRNDTEAIRSYRQYWIEEGCIEPLDGNQAYGVTDKGVAWIEKALSTPMPVQKWVWE